MFINPKTAIEQGWITHPDCTTVEDWETRKFLGPNAIDFTLDHLYTIDHNNVFIISEDSKTMRGGKELPIAHIDANGVEYWTLSPHDTYDGLSNIRVNLPEGVACMLIIRSTFNRNGIFLTSGLYDSGYQGAIGMAVHNRSGVASIQKGMRFGQIIFISSDAAGMYQGGWNHAEGTHWSAGVNNVQ